MIVLLRIKCSFKPFLSWRNNTMIARYNLGNAIRIKLEQLASYGATDFDVGARYRDRNGISDTLWSYGEDDDSNVDLARYSNRMAELIIGSLGNRMFTSICIYCFIDDKTIEKMASELNIRDYRIV